MAAIAAASIWRIIDERDRASAAELRATEQRALAEKRSEQLLLERARTLARVDPTTALATLKLLPPASAVWPAAWGIAGQAQVAGASFGLRRHRDDIFALEFSPDGTSLASGGNDGLLQVHELATQRPRTLAQESSRIAALRWMNQGWLAYATEDALVTMELASGREHRLPVAASDLHAASAGQALRYLADGKLYQVDLALRTPRALTLARHVIGAGQGTLVSTGEQLVWVDAELGVEPLQPYTEPFLIAAVDDAGRHLVISNMQEVRQLERRDHALFVAFAPYDAPRYAVSVVVEHGGGGSTAAAPIARDILLRAMSPGLPPLSAYPASQRGRIETMLKELPLRDPATGAAPESSRA
mgnify:CR=1 FL=1